MVDDLTLIDGNMPLSYREPVGSEWGAHTHKFLKMILEKAKGQNEAFLRSKFKNENTQRFILPWVRRMQKHCRI